MKILYPVFGGKRGGVHELSIASLVGELKSTLECCTKTESDKKYETLLKHTCGNYQVRDREKGEKRGPRED